MRILLPNTVSLSILSSRLFYIPTLRLKLIFSFSLGFLSKEFFASSKPGASTPLPPCWVPLGKDSFACQHKKDSYEVVWIHISSCFFWSTARRSACCFYLLLSSCKTCKRLSHIKNLACDAERLLYLAAGLWPCAKQQCHFFLQQIQVRPSPSPLRWRPHLPQWAWNSPWSPALFWWPSSFLKPVNHLSNFCHLSIREFTSLTWPSKEALVDLVNFDLVHRTARYRIISTIYDIYAILRLRLQPA